MAQPFQQQRSSSNSSTNNHHGSTNRHPLSQSRKRPAAADDHHDIIDRRNHNLVQENDGGHSYFRNNYKRVHLVSFDWREDGRVDAVRAKMVEQLQLSLDQRTKTKNQSKLDRATVAKVMEKILFQQATSLESYLKGCRHHNLDQHLKLAAARLLERKLQRADQQLERKASQRAAALVQALGNSSKFEQVQALVQAIHLLRTGETTTTTLVKHFSRRHASTSAATTSSRTPVLDVVSDDDDDSSQCSPPNDSRHCPVRALYFGTPLVAAFEQSPIQDLKRLHWDRLIAQAEHNVRAYKVWMTKTRQQNNSMSESHHEDES